MSGRQARAARARKARLSLFYFESTSTQPGDTIVVYFDRLPKGVTVTAPEDWTPVQGGRSPRWTKTFDAPPPFAWDFSCSIVRPWERTPPKP